MKPYLYIYAALIILFLVYNIVFPVADAQLHNIINIIWASCLFLYIAIMALVLIKKIKNRK